MFIIFMQTTYNNTYNQQLNQNALNVYAGEPNPESSPIQEQVNIAEAIQPNIDEVEKRIVLSRPSYIATQSFAQAPSSAAYLFTNIICKNAQLNKDLTGLFSALMFRVMGVLTQHYLDKKITIKDLQNLVANPNSKVNPITTIIKDTLLNVLPLCASGIPYLEIRKEITQEKDPKLQFVYTFLNFTNLLAVQTAIILSINPKLSKCIEGSKLFKAIKDIPCLNYEQKITNSFAKEVIKVLSGTVATFTTFFLIENLLDKSDNIGEMVYKTALIGAINGAVNSATNQVSSFVYSKLFGKSQER